jgi:MoxR-like ATPase
MTTDITGVNVFNQQTREFEFQPGPTFANVVLGDEINRAPPKTQSALLEAMEEEQVTVDGETRALPQPFTVIATQNTVEPAQTYELPLAELDRFTKRLELGYPEEDDEVRLLDRAVGEHPIERLESVTDTETLRRVRATVSAVTVSEEIRRYATRLAAYTREHSELGVSPRGVIALLEAAQARAVMEGREYVRPDDVKHEAPVVFSHRIHRPPSGPDEQEYPLVSKALESVSVP